MIEEKHTIAAFLDISSYDNMKKNIPGSKLKEKKYAIKIVHTRMDER